MRHHRSKPTRSAPSSGPAHDAPASGPATLPSLLATIFKAVLRLFTGRRQDRTASRPSRPLRQVAALPVRIEPDGELRVLLITSRGSGKLLIPKGWPMRGKTDQESAAIEAREEAGLVGEIKPISLGYYMDWKRQAGRPVETQVTVYRLIVQGQLGKFRERGQRDLSWLSVEEAARRVANPGLKKLIRELPASVTPRGSRTQS